MYWWYLGMFSGTIGRGVVIEFIGLGLHGIAVSYYC